MVLNENELAALIRSCAKYTALLAETGGSAKEMRPGILRLVEMVDALEAIEVVADEAVGA